MKRFAQSFPLLLLAGVTVLAGCSKSGGDSADQPTGGADKSGDKADDKSGVVLDAETQERIGIKIESPAAAQWSPVIRAVGRAADPLAFTAAVADYESARAAAVASQAELDRTQKLAAGDNASPRTLEAAVAAAARDNLAFKSAQMKFTTDWGPRLAAQTNLLEVAGKIQSGDTSFVHVMLSPGTLINPLPSSATLFIYNDETNSAAATFADDLTTDPTTQVQSLLFTVDKKLPANVAVTALLKTEGAPKDGVLVPFSAVLRYEGKGWTYEQVDTNRFQRIEVPLDHPAADGWFMSDNLSATNRIITVGAGSVLSAEMGGGFNTGTRD